MSQFIPYGRQEIDDDDVRAVVATLRSDFLTQGPAVGRFEAALAERLGARGAVACANGTAALHLCALALGVGPGEAWITTPLTFLATANAARYVGATPVFADVDSTGCLDPATVPAAVAKARKQGLRPKVLAAVDLAGQPADWAGLQAAAAEFSLALVDDACHALGARWQTPEGEWRTLGGPDGATLTVLSFHPVKHVTTGEGGAILTDDPALAERLCLLRSHGLVKGEWQVPEQAFDAAGRTNPWYYEQQALGFNYRLTDLQAALGLSQLAKLDRFLAGRRAVAARYDEAFKKFKYVKPLAVRQGVEHAYHLYIVRVDFAAAGRTRAEVMGRLAAAGIGTQVHYIPVHLQPDYRRTCGTKSGDCPKSEALYQEILSLPIFPGLTGAEQDKVVAELARAVEGGGS
jgi:UDP-4-amino-4,6-dideoxy-N-acetyl-beta-L-altrosamine transaminase